MNAETVHIIIENETNVTLSSQRHKNSQMTIERKAVLKTAHMYLRIQNLRVKKIEVHPEKKVRNVETEK